MMKEWCRECAYAGMLTNIVMCALSFWSCVKEGDPIRAVIFLTGSVLAACGLHGIDVCKR